MEITNAETAAAWLQTWGGNPRPGILRAALDGLRMARGIVAGRGGDPSGYDAAIATLEAAGLTRTISPAERASYMRRHD